MKLITVASIGLYQVKQLATGFDYSYDDQSAWPQARQSGLRPVAWLSVILKDLQINYGAVDHAGLSISKYGFDVLLGGGQKQYSVTNAASIDSQGKIGGLVFITVLFELGEANPEIDKILAAIKNGSDTVDSIDLYGLIPKDMSTKFFGYDGSLSAPTVHVMKIFFSIAFVGPEGEIIAPNYRHLQPLNGRKVYITEGMKEEVNLYCHRVCDGLSSCGDSKSWGSTVTAANRYRLQWSRGDYSVQCCTERQITILNDELSLPSFESERHSSWIDATFLHGPADELAPVWYLEDDLLGSDHRLIRIEVAGNTPVKPRLAHGLTDVAAVKREAAKLLRNLSPYDITEALSALVHAFTLEAPATAGATWWTSRLGKLKAKFKRAQRRYHRHISVRSAARRKFNAEAKKAKGVAANRFYEDLQHYS
ncbi:hypothetical protein FOZ61_007489 [Perkinsus olseni]|uniref:Alpha-carbonic anhydrase domain-containing protein n=1 Tax=Perkinsus olseni TaxID=32597 RepID=A0A7J6LIB0_PEROL|nr:hypothetical protein FOZ61_007489 [Perkinsus olseni]KAF4659014.1 hypothetical protein FOL46_006741 [Perkinsus olseni]